MTAPRLPAISEIKDPASIRVVIYINGQQVHAPLNAVVAQLLADIAALEARVTALEP